MTDGRRLGTEKEFIMFLKRAHSTDSSYRRARYKSGALFKETSETGME